MHKILVIGCPGSGKTYFSKRLSEKTGIPLCHLDMLFWNSDRTSVTRELFLERLGDVLERDEWIIDGNYSFSMEKRLEKCDTVFFFDLPAETCIEGVLGRRGKRRDDLPWNEADYPVDEEFLQFIRDFKEKRSPNIIELLGKFNSVKVTVFSSRNDADKYLESL